MQTFRWTVAFTLMALLTISTAGAIEPIKGLTPKLLGQWQKDFPKADLNGDGTLTAEELLEYQRTFFGSVVTSVPVTDRYEYTFATMSDGVKIALAIGYPKDFDPSRKWATILVYSGYIATTLPYRRDEVGDQYVIVSASLRGTGASGGDLDPYRDRSGQDAYEIIENWIVKQPWSNGRVGMLGHSWPGFMGVLSASTNPPSLKAICVSGLANDFYRDLCRTGGMSNYGFPVRWMSQYYRLDGPFGTATSAQHYRKMDAASYAAIVASRPPHNFRNDLLWSIYHEPFDSPNWQSQSLGPRAAKIRVPTLMAHYWQDEQSGPCGYQLFNRIADDVPKRMIVANGHHIVRMRPKEDIRPWFEHWLLDIPHPELLDRSTRVECHFELADQNRRRPYLEGPRLMGPSFPFPETQWVDYYLHAGKKMSSTAPTGPEPSESYRVSFANSDGPEGQLRYLLEFPETTAICGPSVVTFWATLNTLDTDFYVLLADVAPDGKVYGLQRGLLRASHRELDKKASTYIEADGRQVLIYPFHPHTRVDPVTPYEPTEYVVGLPAVGHVFRPGHKLALFITRPRGEVIGETGIGGAGSLYDSHPPLATVTILHDAEHPSRLQLPVLPKLPPLPEPPVPIERQAGIQEVLEAE